MDTITLTAGEITNLLASSRTRGAVSDYVLSFASKPEDDENAMAVDLMTVTQFSQKQRDSLYNSFNQNIKKLKSEGKLDTQLKVVKQNDSLFLVNIDRYTAQLEADELENSDENDTTDDE